MQDLSNIDKSLPTISVIIVCRNAKYLLEETLCNIDALKDPRIQTIVVDGNSTDGTKSLLNLWKARLFYFISEEDKGIYDAMNKGWSIARSESYILFLGAGDYILQLPKNEELFDSHGCLHSVIIGDCLMGRTLFTSRWDSGMRFHNTAHHQALLVHKPINAKPPFDCSLNIFADWDFNLRLFYAGVRAKRVDRFRSFAKPNGVSAHPDIAEVVKVAKRHSGSWAGWVAWARYRVFLLNRALWISKE